MRSKSLAKYCAVAVLALVAAEVPTNKADASVSIGINFGFYPDLVAVPGYPVYYAPSVDGNLFFYDGLYWVLVDDDWYSSRWYNGPWDYCDRFAVPEFVLRVPVRYYRRPPVYFRGWDGGGPPRWGDHWGRDWDDRRRGWDQWDHRYAPPRAPLPYYQRDYYGSRYPHDDEQRAIMQRHYGYRPQWDRDHDEHGRDEHGDHDGWRGRPGTVITTPGYQEHREWNRDRGDDGRHDSDTRNDHQFGNGNRAWGQRGLEQGGPPQGEPSHQQRAPTLPKFGSPENREPDRAMQPAPNNPAPNNPAPNSDRPGVDRGQGGNRAWGGNQAGEGRNHDRGFERGNDWRGHDRDR